MAIEQFDDAIRYKGEVTSGYADRMGVVKQRKNNLIRDLVLHDGRVDVLAKFVLYPGMENRPYHQDMMDWQDLHKEAMILAWRGCGKSTYCTVTRAIFEILRNPNIRILIVSDSEGQSKGFLRAIQSQFEANSELKAIFGDFRTGTSTWSATEIIVPQRTAHYIEPTILCAGIGTALPSKHFDLILADDLVTLDNSRTEGLRKKVTDYFYRTLYPTLDSPHGRLYILGTRWHEADLYGHFADEDHKASTLIVGLLDEETDMSKWEEKFPTSKYHRIRRGQFEAFELQYMCRANAGGAGIIVADHFEFVSALPGDLRLWQGVDAAIGRKAHNDHFAHCTLGIQKSTQDACLVGYNLRKLSFPNQVKFIADRFDEFNSTVRVGIETNAYQDALKQQLFSSFPHVPSQGRQTQKDKVVRAQQVAAILTNKPLKVLKIHHAFVRLLCGFPNKKGSKDLFDAFEIALGMGLRGVKKKRRAEPGLL